jgi:hypothetical protein
MDRGEMSGKEEKVGMMDNVVGRSILPLTRVEKVEEGSL